MDAGEPTAGRAQVAPGLLDMFLAWGKVGLMGFGGVTAWARRMDSFML